MPIHHCKATWYTQSAHSRLADGTRYGAGEGYFAANFLRRGGRYELTSRSGRSLILTCRDREARGHHTIDLPRPTFIRLYGRRALVTGVCPVSFRVVGGRKT